jgi:sterol desaturase/sphingolipid hydroxylase (fatty acid hydroxylase superfamily)
LDQAINHAKRVARLVRDAIRTPLDPGSEFFWLFLLTAAVIAALTFAWAGGRSPRTFLRDMFPARVWWHPSARLDYAFFFTNFVLYALFVGPWLFTVSSVALPVRDGLAEAFGQGPVIPHITWWMIALYTVVQFLVHDFGLWLCHWFAHRVPALWELHKVHHSALVLVPLTNARAHPLDLFVIGVFSNLLVGIVGGFALYLGGRGLNFWHVYGTNVFFFAFHLLGSNLRHAPFWLSYGPTVEKWVISPAQHQLHHSTAPRHWDRNMGFVLAVWDRMFGTLYVPKGHEQVVYGLSDGTAAEYQSLWALYWLPVKRAALRLMGRPAKRAET